MQIVHLLLDIVFYDLKSLLEQKFITSEFKNVLPNIDDSNGQVDRTMVKEN